MPFGDYWTSSKRRKKKKEEERRREIGHGHANGHVHERRRKKKRDRARARKRARSRKKKREEERSGTARARKKNETDLSQRSSFVNVPVCVPVPDLLLFSSLLSSSFFFFLACFSLSLTFIIAKNGVSLMILFLIAFCTQTLGMKIPAAFSYASTRMLLAAMTTLLCTIFLGPRFIKKLYELKIGQSIRVEDCPMLAQLHQKKKDTPTMGGILILFSLLLSLLLWMDLRSSFTLILLITTLWLGWIGGYDDYLKLKYKNAKGMRGKKKLLFQLLLSALVGLYLFWPAATESVHRDDWFSPPTAKEQIVTQEGKTEIALTTQEYASRYYLPFLKEPLFILKKGGILLGILFTLFVITGSSNAVNLTDGLDGLAAGCLVMVSLVLGFVAFLSNHIEISKYLNILYIEGSGEIAIYLFALIGACLGFLWYNGYPAQVIMGDTGSLALGGIIGVSAVLLRREVLLGLVGGIFVAEALSVILQVGSYKWRHRKRIFLCAPLHHHFEYKGWPETKVVLRFWIIGLILAMIGVISLKLQ